MPALRLVIIRFFPKCGSKSHNSDAEAGGSSVKPKRHRSTSSSADNGSNIACPEGLHISRKRQYEVKFGRKDSEGHDSVIHLVEIRGGSNV